MPEIGRYFRERNYPVESAAGGNGRSIIKDNNILNCNYLYFPQINTLVD
jgi:hypothetical protein